MRWQKKRKKEGREERERKKGERKVRGKNGAQLVVLPRRSQSGRGYGGATADVNKKPATTEAASSCANKNKRLKKTGAAAVAVAAAPHPASKLRVCLSVYSFFGLPCRSRPMLETNPPRVSRPEIVNLRKATVGSEERKRET